MSDKIIPIVGSYLLEKRESKQLNETKYIERLREINIPENRIPDFLLNMEDVWVYDEFLSQKIKLSIFHIYLSYSIICFGIILTLLTYLGLLFENKIQIAFYGLVAAGLLSLFKSRTSLSKLKLEREIQKYKWKEWE